MKRKEIERALKRSGVYGVELRQKTNELWGFYLEDPEEFYSIIIDKGIKEEVRE